jgi:hypothetical protein
VIAELVPKTEVLEQPPPYYTDTQHYFKACCQDKLRDTPVECTSPRIFVFLCLPLK